MQPIIVLRTHIFLWCILVLSAALDCLAESSMSGESSSLTERVEVEDTASVYEGLFEKQDPLHLTLKFDVKTFQRTRADEEYHPAEMTCMTVGNPGRSSGGSATIGSSSGGSAATGFSTMDTSGDHSSGSDTFRVTHPVRVKARGIYRMNNCYIPPFWLNIRYSGFEAEELEGIRRMKMVTRCRSAREYEDYVLREYLVYKLYNLVTPYSFRVRLVRLKFIDTGRKNKETEEWAFLIEPEEMMARRLYAQSVKSDDLTTRIVNRDVMDLLAMFQYMIGNGDYSVAGRHNLKILTSNDGSPVGFIPVPYDFDYTGIVNTGYAIPGEGLGIEHVRERYFLGPCRGRVLHEMAIEELQSLHDEIVEMILGFEYMDENEKVDMVAYLQEFFNQAGKEDFMAIMS